MVHLSDRTRKLVIYTGIGIISLAVLVSGPLVPITLTGAGGAPNGSLDGSDGPNVSVAQPPPDPFRFIRNGDTYQAVASPVVVEVTTDQGGLLIIYRLEISALGYAHETLQAVNEPLDGERLRITKPNVTIDARSINRTEYDGEVIITVSSDGSSREIYRSNVTVQFRS